MKDKILEQMGKELKLATRVDMVLMVVAVVVTLTFFALASGSAAGTVTQMPDLSGLGGGLFGGAATQHSVDFSVTSTIIMFVTLIIIFIINWYAIRTLRKNKAQRAKMNEGMAKLLKDEAMDQYNDGTIYKTYETRYSLLTVIIGSVMALSIIVPLVIFINQMTKL